jgi:5-methylcytosine-specific restriction endonuclease McrA
MHGSVSVDDDTHSCITDNCLFEAPPNLREPLWKQGRVKLTGPAFTKWREAVLNRDHWRCRRCNSPERLHVHHIIKRSDIRLDTLENGITLCHVCHDLAEGKVKNRKLIILPAVEGDAVNANGLVRFRVI